jgi:predicted nucleotidyltransferase
MDNERNIICRTIFGSKLYGTDSPDSDTDYKSVFMPTEMEILTGKIPKTINMTTGKNNSRNSAEDIDHESFSLHYFMELLYQGQTVALDMLHGNLETIQTPIWRELKSRRREFYTKNMRAFVGYARKQAAKYGVKGSRLDAAREALAFLMTRGDRTIQHLYEHGELWEGEHIHLSLYTLPDSTTTTEAGQNWLQQTRGSIGKRSAMRFEWRIKPERFCQGQGLVTLCLRRIF